MYTPEVLLQRERQDRVYYPVASMYFSEWAKGQGSNPSAHKAAAANTAGIKSMERKVFMCAYAAETTDAL